MTIPEFYLANCKQMTIQDFLKATFKNENGMCFRNRLVCNDGYSISAQAGSGFYCEPRRTQEAHRSIELGFPSEEDDIINAYAESPDDYTQTVYPFVPIDVVQELVDKHGGIDIDLVKTK